MQIPSIPLTVLAGVFVPVALLVAWVATLVRAGQADIIPPAWMTRAVIAAVVYQVIAVAYVVLLHRQIDGVMGQRMRAKGIEPRTFAELAGICVFLCPVSIALLLSLKGLPLAQMCVAAAFSTAGMVWWVWWCRRRPTSVPTP